jgi:hypothetical protein
VVVLEFANEPTALKFERYLKSGSGRAFAARHFDPTENPEPKTIGSKARPMRKRSRRTAERNFVRD